MCSHPLIVNTYDNLGGAARAAYRLHKGLQALSVDSRMLVCEKFSDDPTVFCPERKRYNKVLVKLRSVIDPQPVNSLYPGRIQIPYSLNWLPERYHFLAGNAKCNIINLHWISAGFLRIESLKKFNAPIVWTIHDMWPFTGGCHYNQDCTEFHGSCGACPLLKSTRKFDLSRWVWKRKAKAWKDLNLTIVSPSRWLAEQAKKSSLFGGRRIVCIPNGLDTHVFKPVKKEFAREVLNIPKNKQLILFGCANAVSDKRKGFSHLVRAFSHLRHSSADLDIELVVFGSSQPEESTDLGFKTHYLGFLHDDTTLSFAYAAADIFVASSEQDNLPNTVMESLACGTPCAAFNIGGMPDMIDHKGNGYLAKPFDPEDLANGILWVLNKGKKTKELSVHSRYKAINEFDFRLQAQRYLELYNQVNQFN